MKNKGFTLIELLIITLIISTLSLIAIPQYCKYKTRGLNATAISDLRNAATAQEAYFVDHTGYTSSWEILKNYNFLPSDGVELLPIVADKDSYIMQAKHSKSDDVFTSEGPGGIIQ